MRTEVVLPNEESVQGVERGLQLDLPLQGSCVQSFLHQRYTLQKPRY